MLLMLPNEMIVIAKEMCIDNYNNNDSSIKYELHARIINHL